MRQDRGTGRRRRLAAIKPGEAPVQGVDVILIGAARRHA
jgi:hypothetical protein